MLPIRNSFFLLFFNWQKKNAYIYGVQYDVLKYIYIGEWLNQVNEHMHYLTWLSFFFVLRILKIYSLCDFPTQNTLLLIVVTMLYLELIFTLLKFCIPWQTCTQFPNPPHQPLVTMSLLSSLTSNKTIFKHNTQALNIKERKKSKER